MVKGGKLLFLVILCFLLAITICGCDRGETEKINAEETSKEVINDDPIYNLYNKVDLNDPKDQLEKSLGVEAQKDEDNIYNYVDPATGYGVFISYDENNKVEMKGIFMPEGPKKLIALSGARVREEEVESINKGMEYDEVVSILGPGAVEIIAKRNPNDPDNHYYAIGWINEDESLILVYFGGFKGKVENTEFLKLS